MCAFRLRGRSVKYHRRGIEKWVAAREKEDETVAEAKQEQEACGLTPIAYLHLRHQTYGVFKLTRFH